jgi:hypothetical protein
MGSPSLADRLPPCRSIAVPGAYRVSSGHLLGGGRRVVVGAGYTQEGRNRHSSFGAKPRTAATHCAGSAGSIMVYQNLGAAKMARVCPMNFVCS